MKLVGRAEHKTNLEDLDAGEIEAAAAQGAQLIKIEVQVGREGARRSVSSSRRRPLPPSTSGSCSGVRYSERAAEASAKLRNKLRAKR